MPTIKLGKDAKAYRNTGTFGTPTWNEVDGASKLAWTGRADKAEGTRRASGFFKQYGRTLIDLVVGWEMFYDLTDDDLTTIETAWAAGTEIDMIFLSGVVTSGANVGPRISACFTDYSRNEDEHGLQTVTIEASPGLTNLPSLFTGTA